MSNRFKITTAPVTKVSVTITRQSLWKNYIESWADIAWDGYVDIKELEKVSNALISSDFSKCQEQVRSLFRSGCTFLLLASAMEKLDKPDILMEVVVQEPLDNGEISEFVINHEDINF